jgi:hypothetical protein
MFEIAILNITKPGTAFRNLYRSPFKILVSVKALFMLPFAKNAPEEGVLKID